MIEIFKIDWDIHFTGKINHSSSVTNFRALQVSQTHTGKTRQCVQKKKTSTSETAYLVEDANSILISSIETVSILLRNMLEKSLQYRHFTRNRRIRKWSFASFVRFLVEPLAIQCLLIFPSRHKVKWSSPKSGLEKWQGFFHPKIVSWKNVPAKMPFYMTNCRQVLLVLSPTRTSSIKSKIQKKWHAALASALRA